MKKIILFALILSFCSCSSLTKYVEVPVEVVRTEYVKQIVYDSIYIKDSTERYRFNDTVYIEKYRYKYIYSVKNDTLIKIDSIPVVIKETLTKEVKKVPLFYKIMTWIGLGFCLIFIIWIILKIKK